MISFEFSTTAQWQSEDVPFVKKGVEELRSEIERKIIPFTSLTARAPTGKLFHVQLLFKQNNKRVLTKTLLMLRWTIYELKISNIANIWLTANPSI